MEREKIRITRQRSKIMRAKETKKCKFVLKRDALITQMQSQSNSKQSYSGSKKDIVNKQLVRRYSFKKDQIVFAKLRGYPNWPARVRFFPIIAWTISVEWFVYLPIFSDCVYCEQQSKCCFFLATKQQQNCFRIQSPPLKKE